MLSTYCLWFPDSDAQVRNGTWGMESREEGYTCPHMHVLAPCTVYRIPYVGTGNSDVSLVLYCIPVGEQGLIDPTGCAACVSFSCQHVSLLECDDQGSFASKENTSLELDLETMPR
jgi:hypothetical protein